MNIQDRSIDEMVLYKADTLSTALINPMEENARWPEVNLHKSVAYLDIVRYRLRFVILRTDHDLTVQQNDVSVGRSYIFVYD
jgi:hypothetical protein